MKIKAKMKNSLGPKHLRLKNIHYSSMNDFFKVHQHHRSDQLVQACAQVKKANTSHCTKATERKHST